MKHKPPVKNLFLSITVGSLKYVNNDLQDCPSNKQFKSIFVL